MKTKRSVMKTRRGWAAEGGAVHKFSAACVRRAFDRRRKSGWVILMPAEGPQDERVIALDSSHQLAAIARDYAAGVRTFDRLTIETALQASLASKAGARSLAKVGFAVMSGDALHVQVEAADPDLAFLVNRSRIGPQRRGYKIRKVLASVLSLRKCRQVTDDRREAAALILETYGVDASDICACRRCCRLQSPWHLPPSGNGCPQPQAA